MRLALVDIIAQFSTTADQTVDDLKVELLYPADDESEARALAEAPRADD